jgi:Protein of unknown function (DUF1036)
MALTFCNRYSFTPGHDIWVAIMWHDSHKCPEATSGKGYNVAGWWRIEAGGCTTVWNVDMSFSNYWAYYAYCTDGAVWAGDIQSWVSDSAFRLCLGERCTPCRVVGFRLLDYHGGPDFTKPLVAHS